MLKVLTTFWMVKRVTREGARKWPKFKRGKTGHLKEGGPKNGQNFGWSKISTFWASLSSKKVLLTAEKVVSAQN